MSRDLAISLLPPQVPLRPQNERQRNSVAPFGSEWPEWIEELLFVAWVESDRNAQAALRRLEEQWDSLAPEGEPYRPVPYKTLSSWIRRHDWHAKADQLVATNFPGLRVRQVAMLVHANTMHIATINDIAAGLYNDTERHDPRAVRNMLEAARVGLMAGGIGTFGSRDRVAPVVRAEAPDPVDTEAMTPQELARRRLELLHRGKTEHSDRRR